MMKLLLTVSKAIDALNERIGRAVIWLVLVTVVVSAGNALARYMFNSGSNAWLELQWYLFAAIFLLCAGYTLLHDEHIRIDVVFSKLSPRTRHRINVFGAIFFLLPFSVAFLWLSWPVFVNAWVTGEISPNAGGLIRWPARLLVPVGFFLLLLQGISELIKNIAMLRGDIPDVTPEHEPTAASILQEQEPQ